MSTRLEVIFSPAEFERLTAADLRGVVCVVFDVLRATTSMMAALGQGAREIFPVAAIEDALALRAKHPDLLLAGERDGLRIRGNLTGGIDFDFGNSPREFRSENVNGRSLAMTTTNGTRALRACASADAVILGSFLGLSAVSKRLTTTRAEKVLLVCSGTYEEASFEDALGAGALCAQIWPQYEGGHVADSAEIARQLFLLHQGDLMGAMRHARNGRRLLAMPELREDVAFCLQKDQVAFVARMDPDGAIRRDPVFEEKGRGQDQ